MKPDMGPPRAPIPHQPGETLKAVSTTTHADLEFAKWIAIIAMTIDHYGKIVDPSLYAETNAIGRLTFPLLAWIMGTRLALNPRLSTSYLTHLTLWAFIAQPVFVFAGKHWHELNILFTLCLGVAIVWGMQLLAASKTVSATLVLVGGAVSAFFVDYGPFGVMMIPAISLVAGNNVRKGAWWCGLLGVLSNMTPTAPYFGPCASCALFASVVALASLRFRFKLPRLPKILFYAYYPAHILLLSLIARQLSP